MTRVAEAVFTQGVLRLFTDLGLQEQQRVRIVVEPIESAAPSDREAAFARLRAGIARMHFRASGPLPTRDELHERF